MSVKITCEQEENRSCWIRRFCGHVGKKIELKRREQKRREEEKEERRGVKEWSDHGGRDDVLTISGRRTLYG